MSSGPGPGAALRRAWGVAPTTSSGVTAMSAERRARLLVGHDAVTVLEAASTVLDDIEKERFDAVAARLPLNDQRTLQSWIRRAQVDEAKVAPTPIHALALLAATPI